MTQATFPLDTFVGSQLDAGGERIELRFRDQHGLEYGVSLPVATALALKPIIADLEAGPGRLVAASGAAKVVKRCQIGRSDASSMILLAINDETPFALRPEDAKSLWRELRKETDAQETRPAS